MKMKNMNIQLEFKTMTKLCNLRADIESMRSAILDFYGHVKGLPNPEDRDSNFDELCDLMRLDEGEVIERIRKRANTICLTG